MRIALSKTFDFEAAHWLPTFPEGHKCRRMHGHSFHIDVVVEGEVPPEQGYLQDFGELKAAIAPIQNKLDHYVLNEVEGLANPTAEMLAKWVYDRLKPSLPLLALVRVHETCTSMAEYGGK
jgi:6-pyruvoyltetrahydropterin/6-carboxytetrahydropterin synthase